MDTQLPELSASQPPILRPAILGAFEDSLSVKRVPNTRLLDLTFESTDPHLAARVLNAHLNLISSRKTSIVIMSPLNRLPIFLAVSSTI